MTVNFLLSGERAAVIMVLPEGFCWHNREKKRVLTHGIKLKSVIVCGSYLKG